MQSSSSRQQRPRARRSRRGPSVALLAVSGGHAVLVLGAVAAVGAAAAVTARREGSIGAAALLTWGRSDISLGFYQQLRLSLWVRDQVMKQTCQR